MVKYIPRSSITIACALMLAGCAAVGPDFHRPASEGVVPGAFARDRLEAGQAPTLLATTDVRDTVFWSGFGDEQLTQFSKRFRTTTTWAPLWPDCRRRNPC